MNVEIIGRLRPTVASDRALDAGGLASNAGSGYLSAEGSQRLVNILAGNSFTFQELHKPAVTNGIVYRSSVESLVQLFSAGYNVSLIVTGFKGSGKSYTVAGNVDDVGIISITVQQIFSKIDEAGSQSHRHSSPKLCMQAYEVADDSITDLLTTGQLPEKPAVLETAEKGTHVANISLVTLLNAATAQTMFRQAWSRHNASHTTFLQLELTSTIPETVMPTKSWFTFTILPMSPLSPSVSDVIPVGTQLPLSMSAGVSTKSQVAVTQLAAALANQPYPDRIIRYSESLVTKLLEEHLGGNCRTRVLICFSPFSNPSATSELFQLADNLSKVKNFPLLNEAFAQQLLTQYRARILDLRHQLGVADGGLHASLSAEQLKNVEAENVMLRDANEQMQSKLNELQGQYAGLALSKTDLSSQLLMTEEEKLRVSKTLVEMQIEMNRLSEEMEASKFEMTNKILQLEIALAESEEEKKRLMRVAAANREKLEDAEQSQKEMTEEFARLKANNASLAAAHQKEVKRNDELSIELLKTVNAQLSSMEHSDAAEHDRIRAVVSQVVDRPAESRKLDEEHPVQDKPLFEARNQLRQQMDLQKSEFDEERERLHAKIAVLRSEAQEARLQMRETQWKMSELNAQLIMAVDKRTVLESQVNRLQHKLKDTNDEFKSRLQKYIKDIAAYMDTVEKMATNESSTPARMTHYVEDMLDNLKRAHRIREEQLSAAANTYRNQLEKVVSQHEQLLVGYRYLRQQVESRGLTVVELGPDEQKLRMKSAPEMSSSQQQEIEKLRDDLMKKQAELDAFKLQAPLGQYSKGKEGYKRGRDERMSDVMHESYRELEQERARLLSENAVLDEEVKQLQTYIDNHLGRYKEEIVRLRKIIQQFRLAAKLTSNDSPASQTPADVIKSSTNRSRRR